MTTAGSSKDAVDQLQRFSRRWLLQRLPLLHEIRHYNWGKARADTIAASTVALVSIPQAIGFALIVGLPPLMVMLCVIVGGLVCALFSSSRHLIFGPTNSISVILAATIYSFRDVGLTPAELTLLLALMIGVFQLTAGVAQLGKLTQFISRSVIIAYGTGVGILLVAGQVPHLLGIAAGERGSFLATLWESLLKLASFDLNPYSAAMGISTLLVFWVIERFAPKIPAELFGLIFISLFTQWGEISSLGIKTIGDEHALSVAMPSFVGIPLNESNASVVTPLIGAALAIAILGMLEAISISKTMAAKSGQRLDANQELIAMGLANVTSSFYGAMPGSASFARSAASFQSGGQTQFAGIGSSLMVLLALAFVSPLINYIPVPSLAAHLIRIGFKMINWEQVRIAWRSTRSDAIVFAVTLGAAFFLKLDTAIYVGIGTSLALFLRKASAPSLVEYGFDTSGNLSELEDRTQRRNAAISIVHVEGELFFGAADLFQEQVRLLADDDNIRVVILRMKNARHLDATSVMSLLQLHEYLQKSGRHLLVSGINPDVERVLRASGALEKIGRENIFPAEANLTASTKKALLRASHLLQTRSADVRIFYDRNREKASEGSAPAPASDHGRPEDYQI